MTIKLTLKKPVIRGRPEECSECPITSGGNVWGYGPTKAEMAIVGEAPGFEEVREGKPFVGQSGRLLNDALITAGVDRSKVYVTNAVKCRFPAGWTPAQKSAAAMVCSRRLVDELIRVEAKYILALGNVAMEAMFGATMATGITRTRGGRLNHPAGFTVYPCIHPAAFLRGGATPSQMTTFEKDIAKWCAEAHGEGTLAAKEEFSYTVIDNPDAVIALLAGLRQQQEVVIDLETSGFTLTYDEILCVVIARSPDYSEVITSDALYGPKRDRVAAMFNNRRDIRWIGHNISFDVLRLNKMLGITIKPYFDTLVAHYCMDESRGGHDLKGLAAQYFDAPDWEANIRNYLKKPSTDSYAWLPPKVLRDYAAQDGRYTFKLYQQFRDDFEKPENRGLKKLFYEHMMPAVELITHLESNGLHVSQQKVNEIAKVREVAASEAYQEAVRIAGHALNPNSPKQVAVILFEEMKAPTFSQSAGSFVRQLGQATGKAPERSTGAEALERLTHLRDERISGFAAALLSYRTAQHDISNYIESFRNSLEDDGRIHPNFSLTASVTGRLATKNPNVMNLPRDGDMRDCVTAEMGNILVAIDYSQAELRTLAMLSRDEVLKQIFLDDKDVHNMVSEWFYGPGYTKTQRIIAKAMVFGLVYGRGEASIASGFGISLEEARAKMNILYEMVPRLKEWENELIDEVCTKGYVESPLGRRRRFPFTTRENVGAVKRFLINAPTQATSSDITVIAAIDIDKWMPDMSHGEGKVLMPYHDAIDAEIPERYADEIIELMERDMIFAPRKIFGLDCIPWKCSVEAGYSLGPENLHDYKRR